MADKVQNISSLLAFQYQSESLTEKSSGVLSCIKNVFILWENCICSFSSSKTNYYPKHSILYTLQKVSQTLPILLGDFSFQRANLEKIKSNEWVGKTWERPQTTLAFWDPKLVCTLEL